MIGNDFKRRQTSRNHICSGENLQSWRSLNSHGIVTTWFPDCNHAPLSFWMELHVLSNAEANPSCIGSSEPILIHGAFGWLCHHLHHHLLHLTSNMPPRLQTTSLIWNQNWLNTTQKPWFCVGSTLFLFVANGIFNLEGLLYLWHQAAMMLIDIIM